LFIVPSLNVPPPEVTGDQIGAAISDPEAEISSTRTTGMRNPPALNVSILHTFGQGGHAGELQRSGRRWFLGGSRERPQKRALNSRRRKRDAWTALISSLQTPRRRAAQDHKKEFRFQAEGDPHRGADAGILTSKGAISSAIPFCGP
jgi:hypothetical protein